MGKKLSYKKLLSNLNGLTVRKLVPAGPDWVVEADQVMRSALIVEGLLIPRHSRHWRKLRDLPLQGASVTLNLQTGRWRCRSRRCWRQLRCQHSWQVVVTENSARVENTEVPNIQEILLLP